MRALLVPLFLLCFASWSCGPARESKDVALTDANELTDDLADELDLAPDVETDDPVELEPSDDELSEADAEAELPLPRFALEIWVLGDTTSKKLNDGLAGQTPSKYFMGMGGFDLMRSSSDPEPVQALRFADSKQVDLLGETLLGVVDVRQLPAGSYTHARVLLLDAHFDVQATLHTSMGSFPGTIEAVTALSDTLLDGQQRSQGWAQFTFRLLRPYIRELRLPVLPSTAGGQLVQEDNKTWLVFPMGEPLRIDGSSSSSRASIVYEVADSFRWLDEERSRFQVEVFDVDEQRSVWEPIRNYGATGYRVVLE